jgi:hypothetical protein
MRWTLRIFCVVSLFVLLSSANADIVTFQFSGNVTQVPLDDVFGDIAAGDAIRGSYQFDSTAADLVPGLAIGSFTFSAPFGMAATIGAHDFRAFGSLNIGTLDSFVDQYTVLASNASGDLTMELFLQDNTGSVFTNDHLPLAFPPLEGFAQKDFHLNARLGGREIQLDGLLGAPDAQVVPEPRLVGLVLAGSFILLVVVARRRGFLQSIN